LKSNPRDGGPEGLRHDIPRERLGRLGSQILFFRTIGSTNDEASFRSAGLSAERAEGLIVVADEQTAGRGRRGRTWFSPAGSGLYVSVVLTPSRARDPRRATSVLTLAGGVALAEGIEAASGLALDLKWPNDLLVARRKVGGILAEASVSGDVVSPVILGFGINVTSVAYPPDVADRAMSIETAVGRAVDRQDLLIESLAALARRYDDLLAGRFDAILDAWRRRAPAASGARVSWTTASGAMTGITAGIDDDGALLARVGDRIERIVAGEVTWL
jgi:BirA family transcriptional regulator, biotin operon repressor / biotin---[acetyl-CoA-carboxylase] ligase